MSFVVEARDWEHPESDGCRTFNSTVTSAKSNLQADCFCSLRRSVRRARLTMPDQVEHDSAR